MMGFTIYEVRFPKFLAEAFFKRVLDVSRCIHRLPADQPDVLVDLVSAHLPQWAVVGQICTCL
jgi:hypothetical protein